MDTLSFHSIWTLIIFISFIGIVFWAYSSRRQKQFDDIAQAIFDEQNHPHVTKAGEDKK